MTTRVDSSQPVTALVAVLQSEFGIVLPSNTKKQVVLDALTQAGALVDTLVPETGEQAARADQITADNAVNNLESDDDGDGFESEEDEHERIGREALAADQAIRNSQPKGYLVTIHEKDGEQEAVSVRAQNSHIYIIRGRQVVISRAHYSVLNGAKRREFRDRENERGEPIRVSTEVPRHSMDVQDRYMTTAEYEAAKKEYNGQKAEQ